MLYGCSVLGTGDCVLSITNPICLLKAPASLKILNLTFPTFLRLSFHSASHNEISSEKEGGKKTPVDIFHSHTHTHTHTNPLHHITSHHAYIRARTRKCVFMDTISYATGTTTKRINRINVRRVTCT